MRSIVRNFVVLIAITIAGLGLSRTALAAGPCPPDLNCSGAVDFDDLLIVLFNWNGLGPDGDVNSSGHVDFDDILYIIQDWGPCLFDFGPQYPNTEAHQIGLEMLGANGPLTLPMSQYDRVDRDLGLIRTAVPALADQTHSMAWAPNQIIVGLFVNQPQAGYQCYNTYYQVTGQQLLFTSGNTAYWVITFAGKINVPGIAAIYTALPEVSFAEPNGLIGGQNYWQPVDMGNGKWRWTIDDGWLDCFDGCDCHRVYVIDTDADAHVQVISVNQFGQSWCDFGQ